MKWASLSLTLVFVLSLVLGCGKENAPFDVSPQSRLITVDDEGRIELAPASRAHIETAVVGREEGGAAVRAPGRVEFRDGAISQVNAPVEGRVVEVHVRIGDEVKEGDPVVTLRSPEAAAIRNEVDRLRIPLRAARAELERQERLVAQGIGVSSEHFSAQMQVAEVEGEYERARASARLLGNGGGPTVIVRAAMSGTVLTVNTSLGAMADPTGDALVIIGDAVELRVVADVFERDLSSIRVGSPVTVALATMDEPIPGTVVRVGGLVDRAMRRAPVYIDLDELDVPLRPGMFARVSIDGEANEGLNLPSSAVLIKDGRRYQVFVEVGPGLFEPRSVEIGPTRDGRVLILSGVEIGEKVVVKGGLLLDSTADQLM